MGERYTLTPSEGQGLALASALRLELKKLRHKRLWLIALCMVAMQLLWLGHGWFGHRGGGATPGYPALLLQAPALNAVFLPLLSTVIAATVCDVEAGGDMLKSLLTLQRAGSLFWTKLIVSTGMLAIVVTLQEAGLVGIAVAAKLDAIPVRELVIYWVSTCVVCVFCASLAQALSLLAANQFVPMVTGVVLSFFGLFSMYFPEAIMRMVPSAYFGLLSTVGVSMQGGVATYVSRPWAWGYAVVLIVATALLSVLAARAFSRKEL